MNIKNMGCYLSKKNKILYRGVVVSDEFNTRGIIEFIDYKTKKTIKRNIEEYDVSIVPIDIYNNSIFLLEKIKLDIYISDKDYEHIYGVNNIIDVYPTITTLRQLGFVIEHSLDDIDTATFKKHILTKIADIVNMQITIIDEDTNMSSEELCKIKKSMLDTYAKYKTFADACDSKIELIRRWPSILIHELDHMKSLINIEERKMEIL